MKDPRKKMLDTLVESESEMEVIFSSSQPIVLLCGGPVGETRPQKSAGWMRLLGGLLYGGLVGETRLQKSAGSVGSLRNAISQERTDYAVFRPEYITEWRDDGLFANLLDFEIELAAICELVVVILESAGSIAELGAFSQSDPMRRKLIVIEATEVAQGNSFIDLGILRYLQEAPQPSSVHVYPWNVLEPSGQIPPKTIADVLRSITDALSGEPKHENFCSNNPSHETVLIYQLITWFIALKKVEIKRYLEVLKVCVSSSKIDEKLFLLEKFEFIEKIRYGDATFYIHNKTKEFYTIRIKKSIRSISDKLRIQTDCMQFYKALSKSGERNRFGALKNWFAK